MNLLRASLLLALLLVSTTTTSSLEAAVAEEAGNSPQGGGKCNNDGDCAGNLNCVRLGIQNKRCAPVDCAKGAAQALLDSGFDPDDFIGKVIGRMGLESKYDINFFDDSTSVSLQAALADTPLPMDIFQSNYTNCLHPQQEEGKAALQARSSDDQLTLVGLQWSVAALFSYFGKSTWFNGEFQGNDLELQLVSNCIGFLAGGDVGLDVLFQIWDTDRTTFTEATTQSNSAATTRTATDPGNSQCIPVFVAGPIGLQVCWFVESGINGAPLLIEVSFGPSLGAALLGFSQCSYNSLTATGGPDTPVPTFSPTFAPTNMPSPSPKPCFSDRTTLDKAITDGLFNGFDTASTEPFMTYGPIEDWCFASTTLQDFSNLFIGKNSFNEDISKWDVSAVTNMRVSLKINWSLAGVQ